MQHRFFRLWRQAIFAIALLFTLQTTAQPVITYHNKDVEESSKYKKGNVYQKDFLLFMDMLQTTHPAFEKNPPFDVQKELKQGYTRCGKCKNLQEFVFYTQQVAAKIHDAHTSTYFHYVADLKYPFRFYIDGNDYYIDAIQKGMESSLGKQITKINGKDLSTICNQFKSFYSIGNEAGFKKTFRDNACWFFPWHELGLCEPDSSLNLSFSDGSSLKLRPVPANFKNWSIIQSTPSPVEQMRRSAMKKPFSYKILDEGICYLLFDKCQDAGTMKSQSSLIPIPLFSDFLDEMFQAMKEKNINKLVIDVRENDGGNSLLCNELLSRLKSSITSTRTEVRPSQLAIDSYKALGKDPSILYNSTSNHNVWQGKVPSFDGKVIWIQGKPTFSSAGLLITFAVDNNIGTVIGEPASYSPNHYGDLLYWNLPNTNIQGCISHKYFIRPDETKGDEIPLAKILTTSFEDYVNGIDPCYNWATDPANF